MVDTIPNMRVVFGLEAAPANVVTSSGPSEMVDLVEEALAGRLGLRLAGAPKAVLTELGELFKDPVHEVLVTAWNKRAEIRRLADPRQTSPTETNRVWLYEHTFTQRYDVTAAVEMAGVTTIRITFTGAADLTFKGAALVIRGGRVVRVGIGEFSAKATFTAGGFKLVERALGKWPIDREFSLGDGIAIPVKATPAPPTS